MNYYFWVWNFLLLHAWGLYSLVRKTNNNFPALQETHSLKITHGSTFVGVMTVLYCLVYKDNE